MSYDAKADGLACWHLAMRLKALAIGSRRPATVWETYWVEMHGAIP